MSHLNPPKRGLVLDRVVLLGRTLEEYALYFLLELDRRAKGTRILDVASGVSSFTAESNALGFNTTAFDPIYGLDPEEIEARSAADLDHVVESVRNLPVYKWDYYKSPDDLKLLRERARQLFLADFKRNPSGRYLPGLLPDLPFEDGEFDLTLVSYFLFVYEDQFSYEFHRDSVLELARVTRGEVRIYPLVTFEAHPAESLTRLIKDPACAHLKMEVISTKFEFLIGSNSYLKITRR